MFSRSLVLGFLTLAVLPLFAYCVDEEPCIERNGDVKQRILFCSNPQLVERIVYRATKTQAELDEKRAKRAARLAELAQQIQNETDPAVKAQLEAAWDHARASFGSQIQTLEAN